jgi:hypothetical protein
MDGHALRSLRIIALLTVLGPAIMAQPGELRARTGGEVLNGYEIRTGGKLFRRTAATPSGVFVAQLPLRSAGKGAKLAGVFDFDGDGRQEVFLQWMTSAKYPFVHHFEVCRIDGQKAVLIGQFAFEGAPQAGIAFYRPPSAADTPKTVFEVTGGAKWSSWYLLSPDGKDAPKVGDGAGYQFIDLEKTGIYDLVVYKERPFEPVCGFFGYMSLDPGLYPIVFRKNGTGYAKIWPPADWLPYDFQLLDRLRREPAPLTGKHYAVMAALYDIDRDGAAEIVALTDTVLAGDTRRALEVYKVTGGELILKSRLGVAHRDMAVVIYGIRRLRDTAQAALLFADPRNCTLVEARGAGAPALSMAEGFDFRQGQFQRVWRRKFDQFYPYMPAAVTDVDHSGEEEMTFPDRNGSPFLTLRKESEFIAPPAPVLCAIGCPPFCTDAYTKGPPCARDAKPR